MATDATDSAGDTAPDREEGGATDGVLDGGGRMLFFRVGATGAGRGIPAMQGQEGQFGVARCIRAM